MLIRGGSFARYSATGHIVYGVAGTLRAVGFDLDRLEVTGNPVTVLDGVITKVSGAADFSVARDGSLVYVTGGAEAPAIERVILWVDREGREEPIDVPPRAYTYARLSPDGTRVALDSRDEENDIWIWDLARETLQRLTVDPGLNRGPLWTPDGTRVAFTARAEPDGIETIYWQAADGSGAPERLTEDPRFPTAFSPDGTRLVFNQPLVTPYDIGVLDLEGERTVEMLLETSFDERNADISPDGRWLAYQSNESGQIEIYVRPFPDVNASRQQVSTGGGTRPLWSKDGRELFYYQNPGTILAVPVQSGSDLALGIPEVVVEGTYAFPRNTGRHYDVTPDGQRFLLIGDVGGTDDAAMSPVVVLVQNWFDELQRLVPTP